MIHVHMETTRLRLSPTALPAEIAFPPLSPSSTFTFLLSFSPLCIDIFNKEGRDDPVLKLLSGAVNVSFSQSRAGMQVSASLTDLSIQLQKYAEIFLVEVYCSLFNSLGQISYHLSPVHCRTSLKWSIYSNSQTTMRLLSGICSPST